jgi:V4R domain
MGEPAHFDRFALHYDWTLHRRQVVGEELIIHCHHYNSKVQHTIEGAAKINGKHIITSSAQAAFVPFLARAVRPTDTPAERYGVAAALYAYLGFGRLDLTQLEHGEVTATASHFVEGWRAGFPQRSTPVCTFTEGYIQAAARVAGGRAVRVRETRCMMQGHGSCKFEVVPGPLDAEFFVSRRPFAVPESPLPEYVRSPNIDVQKIYNALIEMPIHGDAQGVIPAFNVYLANMPALFYNLISIRFVEEMTKLGLGDTARQLLKYDAETCGLNTFRGILNSAEWDGLIAPMVRQEDDTLFGIIAVSNALGWGNWHVLAHEPGITLSMEARNGYEALGYRELRAATREPVCLMLAGVSAGIMGLIYGDGPVPERIGQFTSTESSCIGCNLPSCRFDVRATS